jgi:hypothetical protein
VTIGLTHSALFRKACPSSSTASSGAHLSHEQSFVSFRRSGLYVRATSGQNQELQRPLFDQSSHVGLSASALCLGFPRNGNLRCFTTERDALTDVTDFDNLTPSRQTRGLGRTTDGAPRQCRQHVRKSLLERQNVSCVWRRVSLSSRGTPRGSQDAITDDSLCEERAANETDCKLRASGWAPKKSVTDGNAVRQGSLVCIFSARIISLLTTDTETVSSLGRPKLRSSNTATSTSRLIS